MIGMRASYRRRRRADRVQRVLLKAVIPACAGLMVMGCSAAQPDALRRQHPAIVSLNPCSDAVLAEIADPGQILALSHYSSDPVASSMDVAAARRFRSVTGSAEEVLALRPDIVIASNFLPPATAAALEALEIPVVRFPIATSIADSKAQVRDLARLIGQAGRGEALNQRIDNALAKAAPGPGETPVATLVWQAGGIVPGGETLIADLLRQTGFASHSAAMGMRQADYLPLEEVLANPPELILAAAQLGTRENRLLSHPALDALAGTSRASFDPSLLWCGGPTIIRAAERLQQVRQDLKRRGA